MQSRKKIENSLRSEWIRGEELQVSIKKEKYNAIIRAGFNDVSGFVNSAISKRLAKKKDEKD